MARFRKSNLRLDSGEKIVFQDAELKRTGDKIQSDLNIEVLDGTTYVQLARVNQLNGGGGATSLNGLTDVTLSSPQNNQVLTYDSTTGVWINQNPTGGSGDGGALDSGFITLSSGDSTAIIIFNNTQSGTNYRPLISLSTTDQVSAQFGMTVVDKSTTGFIVEFSDPIDSNNYYLEWAIFGAGSAGTAAVLNDFQDVTITAPDTGEVLAYDTVTQQWSNKTIKGAFDAGIVALAQNDTSKTISLNNQPSTTGYQIALQLTTTDNPSSQYMMTIRNKTTSGFTVDFSDYIETSNYQLTWAVFTPPYDSTALIGVAPQTLADLSDTQFTSLSDGQFFIFDATSGLWVNSDPQGIINYNAVLSNIYSGGTTGALASITTGSDNFAIGENALQAITVSPRNIAIGNLAGFSFGTTGFGDNIFIGTSSGYSIDSNTDGKNVSIGSSSLYNAVDSYRNVAIGYRAGFGSASHDSIGNVIIGYLAGYQITDTDYNVIIGYQAGYNMQAGLGGANVVIGRQAGEDITTSDGNVAIGERAAQFLTSGNGENTCIGTAAGQGFGSGGATFEYCTFIGEGAGGRVTNATRNVAVGYAASNLMTEGQDNVAVGAYALQQNLTGDFHVCVGYFAGNAITSSGALGGNVCVGKSAGRNLVSGQANVLIGNNAGQGSGSTFSYQYNVCVGAGSGSSLDNGVENTFIGSATGGEITIGSHNVAIGRGAMIFGETPSWNIAIGYQALTGSNTETNTYYGNIVMGKDVAKEIITGEYNTIIGWEAGQTIVSGSRNIIIGYEAAKTALLDATSSDILYISNSDTATPLIYGDFAAQTLHINGTLTADNDLGGIFTEDSDDNIFGGTGAGANIVGGSGTDNFLAGVNAGNALTTGDHNVAIGDNAMQNNQTGNSNVAIGSGANTGAGTGISNTVIIGRNAGASLSSSADAVLIGYLAGQNLASPTRATMIGYNAGAGASVNNNWWCTFIGYRAGVNMSGNNNTIVGADAGTASSTATGNVFVGTRAGEDNVGQNNVMVGSDAGANSDDGDFCTYIGSVAGNYAKGDNNVAIGYLTMQGDSVGGTSTGANNTYVGYRCAEGFTTAQRNAGFGHNAHNGIDTGSYNVAMGYSADNGLENGNNNVSIGYDVGPGSLNSHSDDVLIGYQVGQNLDSNAEQNVLIGSSASVTDSTAVNRIGIGYNVSVDSDNKAVIGNSSVSTIGGYANWTNYSDESIKRNIVDNSIGLEFVDKLRPRKFERKDQPGKVFDGMIAQEVKAVMDELGIEFSGWVEPGSNGLQMLSYEVFVVPLINAVKTLSPLVNVVKDLQEQITELQQELKKIKGDE
jgi:hypothetical protein